MYNTKSIKKVLCRKIPETTVALLRYFVVSYLYNSKLCTVEKLPRTCKALDDMTTLENQDKNRKILQLFYKKRCYIKNAKQVTLSILKR